MYKHMLQVYTCTWLQFGYYLSSISQEIQCIQKLGGDQQVTAIESTNMHKNGGGDLITIFLWWWF